MSHVIKTVTQEQFNELAHGNRFQIEILGLGWDFDRSNIPEYRTWSHSMTEVIVRKISGYDPMVPTGGLTAELYDGVKKFVPKKLCRFLKLYIAIGSSFDLWHGVDAFFYLEGVAVTIDVTTLLMKFDQKTDFLITPEDVLFSEESAIPVGFKTDILKRIAREIVLQRMEQTKNEKQSGKETHKM